MKGIIFFLLFYLFFLVDVSFCGVSVMGELTRRYISKPGKRYEGMILVRNKGSSPSEVKVYGTDYLFYADGRNIYGEAGSHGRSNAEWISLSPNRLAIRPEETVSVHYNIQVPNDPNLKGTYWSMVMVEPLEEVNPETLKLEKGKVKMSLRVVIRHAIQIITDIGNTGISRIKFVDKKVTDENGNKILQIDLENTGERWLSPLIWVELFNEEGKSMGKIQGSKLRIYPGCSVRHKIHLTDVPKGRYKALIVADNGDENIFGSRWNLRIE